MHVGSRAGETDAALVEAFGRVYAEHGDGRRAARAVGATWWRASRVAADLLGREATWQAIEDERARRRYASPPYATAAPASLYDAVYYCCVQRSASQWLKAVFQDIGVYRASGLKVRPYVALGHRMGPPPTIFPPGTLATHLYVNYAAYAAIPKPLRYRAFFVQRDPRDALISWYFAAKVSHMPLGALAPLRAQLAAADHESGLALMLDRLDAWGYLDSLRSWTDAAAQDPEIRIFRFEAMVENERGFMTDIFDYLRLNLSGAEIADLAARHSFERLTGGRRRGVEDVSSHYRRGEVGIWREGLPPAILARFYELTGDLTERLGYRR